MEYKRGFVQVVMLTSSRKKRNGYIKSKPYKCNNTATNNNNNNNKTHHTRNWASFLRCGTSGERPPSQERMHPEKATSYRRSTNLVRGCWGPKLLVVTPSSLEEPSPVKAPAMEIQ